jgi:thiamine-monophosphate kinase
MGELALIERIAARARPRPGTPLGIGDDAALVDVGGRAVLTHDLLVEDLHFRRATAGWDDLGHKALAVNLSDIAAMAAEPVAALVGLVLPPGAGPQEVDRLYAGMDSLAAAHGVTIAGGDLSAGPVVMVAVTAVGRPADGARPLRRSGGRPGDILCVTGALGAAAAGLLVLDRPELGAGVAGIEELREALLRPAPRIAAGLALGRGGARALMDISDGLALDAWRMGRACGLRAEIDLEAVPVAPGAAAVARAAGRDPGVLAATGGDDYELLAAVPPEALAGLRAAVAPLPLTPVGRLEEGEPGAAVLRDGAPIALERAGWEH